MNLSITKSKQSMSTYAMPVLLSIVICLASQLRFFLPFSPVPITLQVHLILLFSYCLGAKRALLMTALFLVQGLCGFSVFATGAGYGSLLGPTGGYLIGYLVASYITGTLNQRSGLVAMGIGNLVVYIFGWMHLSQFVGCYQACLVGIVPFLVTDIIKLSFVCNRLICKRVRSCCTNP